MRRRLAAVGAAAVLVLAGCASEAAPPGAPDVDVDTPTLREMKAAADIAPCAPGDAEPVDGGLPAVELPCLGGGEPVDLASLRGPLVVNLWQSFCGPCREEMPALQRFHERYGDRVGVLGVDYQDVRPEAALELADELGVTYPLVADVGGELNAAGPLPALRGMPVLVLVDADGRVVTTEFGGVTSTEAIVDLVRQHLGVDL